MYTTNITIKTILQIKFNNITWNIYHKYTKFVYALWYFGCKCFIFGKYIEMYNKK